MSDNQACHLRSVAVLLACALSLVTAAGVAQEQSTQLLSKDQVIQLLRGFVSSKRVADLAQADGIDFQVTSEVETELREAGAKDELVVLLRGLAPKTATLVIHSTPGNAHVYVDDEPVGTTSSEGRIKLSNLRSGRHQVRLSLDGYADDAREIELLPGSTIEVHEQMSAKNKSDNDLSSKSPSPLSWSLVYLYREHRDGCLAINPDVYLDGTSLGILREGTYKTIRLMPGLHAFMSTKKDSELGIKLEEGQQYYIRIHMVGFPCKGNPLLVPSDVAEPRIKKLTLVY
jgi:hypothetical protein